MTTELPPAARVLITGGAGFIGTHTCRALVRGGAFVRLLDVLDPQIHGPAADFPATLPAGVECMRGDVRDAADVRRALDGISHVFHFAALTGVGQSMYDIQRYADVNISGTACLIETIAAHALPVARLVLASSRAVYGEGTHACPRCGVVYPPVRRRQDLERGQFGVSCPTCGGPTEPASTAEDRPLSPISIYGWTKREQEELCRYAAATLGLSTVMLRYFNVYGSGQSLRNPYTGIVTTFFNRLQAGAPIAVYEGGVPLRDFVHVSDVVAANLAALTADVPAGTAINIGTGERTSIPDVARRLGEACGVTPRCEDSGEFRIGDIHSCIADLGRARSLLGYRPKVSLRDGLEEFVAWARGQSGADEYQRAVDELRTRGLFGRAVNRPDPAP